MAKKIVCDIQRKNPEKIFLNKKNQDVFVDLKDGVQENLNPLMRDLENKKSHAVKNEKYFYRIVDDSKPHHNDRVGEITRLFAAGLIILFVINISNIYQHGLSLKDNVVASVTNGYGDLVKAGKSTSSAAFSEAEDSFTKAQESFKAAQNEVAIFTGENSGFILQGKSTDSIRSMLQAGQNIAQAGQLFTKGAANLKDIPALFLNQIATPNQTENEQQPAASLTAKLKTDLVTLDQAMSHLQQASNDLAAINAKLLPAQYQERFENLKSMLSSLIQILENAKKRIPILLKLLGDRYPHRYLILLQNDTEARPTGGFIGSFMLVDTNDGYITGTKFSDVYELDGQMHEDILPIPEDIARISKNWRMRDSNYSPDFAISAEKAAWFLQKEKGPSVDTVIAINQHAIAPFIAITGPISIDGLKSTIDQNNYLQVISYIVESKLNGKSTPKKILADFIAEFQKKLAASHDWGNIIKHLMSAIKDRDIMLYSRDEEIEQFFTDIGAAGKLHRTFEDSQNEDYLNIITTSIGGNKSDFYIQQNAIHTTDFGADGTVTNELVLSRTHTWGVEALKNLRAILNPFGFTDLSNEVKTILGSGQNKSIIKIYVPPGSILDATSGIEIADVATRDDIDLQKTYFMFEMDALPGETNTIKLVYHLAKKLDVSIADTYHFIAEKQPGITETYFQKVLTHRAGIKFYAHNPNNLIEDDAGQLTITEKSKKPLTVSVLAGKR